MNAIVLLADGRAPIGDGANAGFLRDGSLLAVLFVTDEDDCSASESSLFDQSDARYASVPNLNMRCVGFRDTALFDVPTLVESLTGLRPQPQDLVVAAIAGAGVNTLGAEIERAFAEDRAAHHMDEPDDHDDVVPDALRQGNDLCRRVVEDALHPRHDSDELAILQDAHLHR
jgi:hypothetical protein